MIAVARGDRIAAVSDELLRAAAAEGLLGLVARAVSSPPRELVMQTMALEARAESMIAELARLATLSRDAGLPMLAFKGPVLSQQLYGSATVRAFSDLDLLFDPHDAGRAEALLRECGYLAMEPLARSAARTNRNFAGQSLFFNDATRVLLDVHTRFSNAQFPIALSFSDAWRRRASVTIGGASIETLGDVDLVLTTCSHAAKHLWHKLEFVAQIAALARREVDWREVDERAIGARVAKQVGLSFLLAREFLDIETPPLPRCSARAERVFDDVKRIVETNLARATRRTDATGRDLALLLDRRSDVARSLLFAALVPTHADWQRSRVPAPLQWLLRPVRLIRQRIFHRRRS